MAENINTVNHRWIRETFEHVNLAVDATCGGGNDTVFLAGLTDSPLRVKPRCRVFDRCGGCQLQHVEVLRILSKRRSDA